MKLAWLQNVLGVVAPSLARAKEEFGWGADELIVPQNVNLRQNEQKKQKKKSKSVYF